ncbi:MAG: hypothetical protein HC859_04735 [Bacteroidia bacterium]|nr:hypothetical protein [Bacteroidia bacterium]
MQPTRGEQFNVVSDEGFINPQEQFSAAGLGLTLKYSWQNRDLTGSYYSRDEKKLIFRKYPDVALEYQWADKNAFDSEFDFQKLSIQLKQKVRMQKLGYLQYFVEAGKTFGTVPYPYLNVPFGNQLLFNDDYAFNLMLFLEYVSDQFVNVHLQHHFRRAHPQPHSANQQTEMAVGHFRKSLLGHAVGEKRSGKIPVAGQRFGFEQRLLRGGFWN